MDNFLAFLLQLLSQFAGGPGPMENNLVRFTIPAITYGLLLLIAWFRQREQNLPRERLLVWGFGLGSASAAIMVVFVALQMLGVIERGTIYSILVPLERALMMAAIIVVAGAFLRYILDDARLAYTYLATGLAITFACLLIALWQWPYYLATLTESRFHTTMISSVFQICTSGLIIFAIVLLRRQRGWLVDVVTIALAFFLVGELLFLLYYITDKHFSQVICPIGNTFPMLAIPLLGYVYLREQSIDKQRAQEALELHRQHLEELVTERTAEIAAVNSQLKAEIVERNRAEAALAQLSHQYELILESAGEGICGIDRQGRLSFVNSAAARLLGYQTEELVGQSFEIICREPVRPTTESGLEQPTIRDGYLHGLHSSRDDQLFWRKNDTAFPVLYVSNPTYENEELTGIVVVFRDITERKQAEAQIAQRNANLAAQNMIATALSRSIELETILDTALEAVLSVAEMEAGLVFLWDATLEELTLRNSRGPVMPAKTKQAIQEWNCCTTISIKALKNLQAVVMPAAECPDLENSLIISRDGIQTLVSVPLLSNGRGVGALTLGSRKTNPIQLPELELLSIFGQQIGTAVENAQLYQKAERAATELALLHQVSTNLTSTFDVISIYDQIVEQSVKLLNSQAACIFDWDKSENCLRLIASYGLTLRQSELLKTGTGAVESLKKFIADRERLVVGDVRADQRLPAEWVEQLDIRALVCLPIQGLEDSPGSLFLMDHSATRRWRHEEIVLIESFVNRAAVALMNARLHKQLEWAAALEERQSLAADMHDGLAQTVSLLGLQIDGVLDLVQAGSSQAAAEELSITRETIRQVSIEVRKSIASLQRTPQPRRSLQELLSALPRQISWEDPRPVEFVFAVLEPMFLPQNPSNQAMFIVQEALLNAHRHARAEKITVFLAQQEHGLTISVVDDGIGFEPERWWENSQNHFGLGIMHSRAARIGAQLQIVSTPGTGTRVTLHIPMVAENRHATPHDAFQTIPPQIQVEGGRKP